MIDRIAVWEAASASVAETARKAIDTLNDGGIPILVTGGLAVIAYGYDAATRDVDLIVPDFESAHRFMLAQGYRAAIRVPIGVIDPETGVRIDILPGGKSLSPRCPVNFPVPTELGYNYVTLPELISTKLGSFLEGDIDRLKDKVAVIELIKANELPRDFPGLDPAIQGLYHEIWDERAGRRA